MKNLALILALVIGLTLTSCHEKQQAQVPAPVCINDSCGVLPIAYINTDTLLMNWEYSKKKQEELMSKEESARAEYNQKARVFQQDVAEFQRKVQNNGFLSLDRAQKEQERLQGVEAELQELNERLSNELAEETMNVNMELRQIITDFLAEYAKGRYVLVLSNTMGDNVLYSAPGLDITAEVVEQLNERK